MADDANPQQKPDFGFIMKQEPKPKRSLGLPTNLPKPVLIGIGLLIALFLIIIAGSLLNSGGGSTNVYSVLSDASVISGVAGEVDSNTTNTDTQNLATTINDSLTSQQQQIKAYLLGKKIKINTKQIATVPTTSVTTKLENSKLNNTYDATVTAYFKTSLTSYQSDLQKTYKDAGPNLKAILLDAYNSNKTLLDSKQLQ